jgi:Mitochondrial carrier protein
VTQAAAHAGRSMTSVYIAGYNANVPLQERHLAFVARKTGKPTRNLGTGLMLLYGGIAGVAAETVVYPLQIVQRYMQVHSKAGEMGRLVPVIHHRL